MKDELIPHEKPGRRTTFFAALFMLAFLAVIAGIAAILFANAFRILHG